MRALCYFLSLDMIGEKDMLIRRIEELLFNHYLQKKNPDDALKETADMGLEYFLKNTKSAGKRGKGPSVRELDAFLKDGIMSLIQKSPKTPMLSNSWYPTSGPGSASSRSPSTTGDSPTQKSSGTI